MNMFERPFSALGADLKRLRVIEEQREACNQCGLSHWRGYRLTLELEHKDGNRANDARENLEAICPNCHSLTLTWRGRNKRTAGRVTDADLLNAITECSSIRQALIAVGMADKGTNYRRAKRLKQLELEGSPGIEPGT